MKTIDFEEIINKRHCNTHSYYANTELVDTEGLGLLFISQELSYQINSYNLNKRLS